MKPRTSIWYNFKRQLWGCLLFVLVLSGCSTTEKKPARVFSANYISRSTRQIDAAENKLKNGDIIFRNGNDDVSEVARQMNRKDSSWSHCGILFIENDSVVVYHALGGEYNPDMKLMREPLQLFCNPRENLAFGVYRFPLDSGQLYLLTQQVKKHYRNGLKFDLFFNFDTDEFMYCTEFVFKSLNFSLGGKLTPSLRTDTIPYGVTTDDIFLHPDCKPVLKEIFLQ